MQTFFRELDHRSNDGIDIQLLWRPSDDRVVVMVVDERSGENFALEVREGEAAMDVFRHPFAYAAWRHIETHAPAVQAA
jgi:hypothetical protein